ncbi:MAG TPA: lipoxygenase family protein [Trichocoleus sp.]|jgi:arachidonate 15-lipoxygenase
MDSINAPLQGNTSADLYQYNYTYLESIGMVEKLPAGESFSQPWLVLIGKQAIKLAINTLITNLGDRGKKGVEDDVREFLGKTLLITLQEEGTSFKATLINALAALVPQLLLQTAPTPQPAVKVTRSVETIVQPTASAAGSGVEISRNVETSIQSTIQLSPADAPSNTVEVTKSVETALDQLLQTEAPSNSEVPQVDKTIQQPVVAPSPEEKAQISSGIDRALQQPLPGIPANEADVEKFIASRLVEILGQKFLKTFVKNILKQLREKSPKGHASSLEDYLNLFPYIGAPDVSKTFQSDDFFAYMRVAGPNPLMITRMTAPDPRFPVTEEQYRSIMGEDSLQTAMQEGRVYLADYGVLDGALNGTFGAHPPVQKYVYAPLALFAVPTGDTADRALRPVAIQCGQNPAEYPIITPATGADAWLMAKTIVQIADVNFHEAVSHFARTHLLVEPFVITTHRQLPTTHPLFKLLVPHFQGTLAINFAAHQFLIAPQGGVNELLSSTIDNSRALMVKGFQGRGFNADMLPQRLKDRGVDDEKALPVYPYRDDGLLIWQAIHDWVSAYLNLYYQSDADVQKDQALQNWAKELVSFDGGRIPDFGDRGDGAIETLAYLSDAVTMIIFTGSAQHAAVNFPQNDIMSFAPGMPTAGYLPAKAIASEATQKDWLNLLPPLDQAQSQLNLLYLLGSVHFTQLGNYDPNYFTDPKVTAPLTVLQNRLKAIEVTIDQRNQTRPEYNYLKPSNIPQSINI